MWEATRAVTINTPVAAVWPWVARLGYGRGGWYGWNPLEREDTGVSKLLPGRQSLQLGDLLLDGPGCDRNKGAWTVKAVERPRTLVLYTMRDPLTGRELDPVTKPGRFIDCGWAFLLDPVGPRTTRLLARTRVRFGPRWLTLPVTVLPVKASERCKQPGPCTRLSDLPRMGLAAVAAELESHQCRCRPGANPVSVPSGL